MTPLIESFPPPEFILLEKTIVGGSIFRQQRGSVYIQQRHLEQTHKEIKAQMAIHLDETGHKECNQNGWAWIMSTQDATYFKLERSRGRKIVKELIGDFRDHIYVTDRYSAYDFLPDRNRQVCWAHLKRDFQKISERSGVPGKIGKNFLKLMSVFLSSGKQSMTQTYSRLKKREKGFVILKRDYFVI